MEIASPEFITLKEAEKRLCVARPCMAALIAQGILMCRRIPGSRAKVSAAQVDRLAESCTRTVKVA